MTTRIKLLARDILSVALLPILLSPATQAAQSSPAPATTLRNLDNSLDQIAEQVSPAVVQILVSGLGASRRKGEEVIERQSGIGSGVIVDPNGYVITNAHVVTRARRIRVLLTLIGTELVPGQTSLRRMQRTFEAKLIGTHQLTDLALLKIEEKDLPYIPLKSDFRIRLGQTVLAIGSPQGLTHTVTMGIISAPARQPNLEIPETAAELWLTGMVSWSESTHLFTLKEEEAKVWDSLSRNRRSNSFSRS